MRLRGSVYSLAFSPNRQYLAASTQQEVVLYDVMTERKIREIKNPPSNPFSIAFSPDGQYLAVGGEHYTTIYKTATGKKLVSYRHRFISWDLSFSPDGRYLSMDNSGFFKYMNAESHVLIKDIKRRKNILSRYYNCAVSSVSFSPDGKFISMKDDCNTVTIWYLPRMHIFRAFRYGQVNIIRVRFNHDGRFLGFDHGRCILIYNLHEDNIIKIEDAENKVTMCSWINHFPVWRQYAGEPLLYYVKTPFAVAGRGNILAIAVTRTGLMALGYDSGHIEIIREGKIF